MYAFLIVAATPGQQHSIELTVTSPIPVGNVPMDPVIDFAKVIRQRRLPGT